MKKIFLLLTLLLSSLSLLGNQDEQILERENARTDPKTGSLILEGEDHSGEDLSEANLRKANLKGKDFSGANLTKATLTQANLKKAILIGADLTEATLTGANFTAANLTGVTLARADLTNATLKSAILTGADLAGAKGYRGRYSPSLLHLEPPLADSLLRPSFNGN